MERQSAGPAQPEAPPVSGVANQARLVERLRHPALYGRDVDQVTVIETHISWVLLTGRYAYKIKKAVDLEFLNFKTLAARRFYCEEEVRLNRRLAPTIYLDVVAITGSIETPVIGGSGPVIEYAVHMRQFQEGLLLSDLLGRGELTPSHIDELAAEVAAFHARTAKARADMPFGRPDDILRPALQNFAQIMGVVGDGGDQAALRSLLHWTEREHARRTPFFVERRDEGFVRECHGDLHLGNIAIVDGTITLFDCIEFNASMRWIDVMNDVAFLVMDLQERKRPDLAARFLNAYLSITGDYDGLSVLRFYVVYRAMVRAKIARLRWAQLNGSPEREELASAYATYVNLAKRESEPPQPAVIITHGVAGSGKTTCSDVVIASVGAVRIQSDIERKRLYGLAADARTHSAPGDGLYSTHITQETYGRVSALVRIVVTAGYTAIADATFLKRWQRDLLRGVAADRRLPFVIIACTAPASVLRARVSRRLERGADASEATLAVLEEQRLNADALAADEMPFVVRCDANTSEECAETARLVANRLVARV